MFPIRRFTTRHPPRILSGYAHRNPPPLSLRTYFILWCLPLSPKSDSSVRTRLLSCAYVSLFSSVLRFFIVDMSGLVFASLTQSSFLRPALGRILTKCHAHTWINTMQAILCFIKLYKCIFIHSLYLNAAVGKSGISDKG